MERSKQLANRFREVILNGKWIANTNFRDQLSDITWQQAVSNAGSLNTIAALTFHVNYYIAGVLNVFEGGDLKIRDKYSFDLPPIESREAWEELLHTMWKNAEKFAGRIELMTAGELDDIFADKKYGSNQRNIEAIIEHSYYHLGQISLLKKMLVK